MMKNKQKLLYLLRILYCSHLLYFTQYNKPDRCKNEEMKNHHYF